MTLPAKYTHQQFIELSNVIHDYKYLYPEEYKNITTHIAIWCPKKGHGAFKQAPRKHLYGQKCPKCARNQRLTTEIFIQKAQEIHHNLYDYSKVNYIRGRDKIIITCKIHGDFEQTPNAHIGGKEGCPKCNPSNKMLLKDFILKASLVHENKYNYDKSILINAATYIIITCEKHGDFQKTPTNHISGKQGCPLCKRHRSSKIENQWLDMLNISPKYRNFKLAGLGKKKVDGYDPLTNTVYEFYGDYWHGNPYKYYSFAINQTTQKTFGELYQKTIERENLIKNLGYKLIIIWEKDFRDFMKNIK